jgi:polyhydroxybutyrate depolymerase
LKRFTVSVALVAAFVIAAGCSSGDDKSASTSSTEIPDGAVRTIEVGGRDRTYRVHRPTTIDRDDPTALVVVLHGGFGSGTQARASLGWDQEADTGRFVVAYADGIGRSWNAGTCCGQARRERVDDVKFIGALIDEVVPAEGVNPDLVYLTGISNGGMMAYRVACELPGKVAAIGPVAATMTVPCSNPAPEPTSVMHIHGLDDRNVPFAGGVGTKGVEKDSRPSVKSVIDRWRAVDRCGTPPPSSTNGPVTTATSGPCGGGTQVVLVTIAGAGHQWPGSTPPRPAASRLLQLDPPSTALDATTALWEFFSRVSG